MDFWKDRWLFVFLDLFVTGGEWDVKDPKRGHRGASMTTSLIFTSGRRHGGDVVAGRGAYFWSESGRRLLNWRTAEMGELHHPPVFPPGTLVFAWKTSKWKPNNFRLLPKASIPKLKLYNNRFNRCRIRFPTSLVQSRGVKQRTRLRCHYCYILIKPQFRNTKGEGATL